MRVALLTNFVAPYRVPFFEALAREAGELRVFVSTRMERNRQWQPEWGSLDVVVQKALSFRRTWRTSAFKEAHELHLPYDTWQQLKRYRPDLIITGEFGARSVQAVAYARAHHVKVALWATITDRFEAGRDAVRQRVRKWLLERVDAVITNGECGARYLHRFGFDDARIIRMPQPVDMRQFLAIPLEREPQYKSELLCVGSISERKGVHLLLDAVNLWAAANRNRTIGLTIVGDGPLKAQLQAQSSEPNARITWIDHLPYDRLHEVYARAGIFVFPSLGDEWGLVVNEALAAGLPVCGSVYAQAVEELIREDGNGWLFEPANAHTIADSIDRALKVPDVQLEQMRGNARETIRGITPEAAARKLVERLA